MASYPRIDPELVLQFRIPETTFNYTERDVALYALGVGAPGANPVCPLELDYVYHPDGQRSIKVLPSFAVILPGSSLNGVLATIKGLHFDPKMLLHGEQYVEVYKPLPTYGKIRSSMRISGLHDKGKAAVVEMEVWSSDAETGNVLCLNRCTLFLRGAGGFSPPSKRFSYTKRTSNEKTRLLPMKATRSGPPDSSPSAVFEEQTSTSQALLYRLSGDYNPLHSDANVAVEAGFQRPILMGLCTLGYAVRAIIRSCCNGDHTRVQSFQGRFLSHVYPGEKLVTEMWLDDYHSSVTYMCKASGRSVLLGVVTLTSTASRL